MTIRWTEDQVDDAAAALRAGGLVAFPTETVYGLGGDGRSDRAVAAIYAAKGRPSFNPLILHVPDLEAALRIADLPAAALVLAERFWPGPLTLVGPLRGDAGVSKLAAAGLSTIALRVPAHALARRLLTAFGAPLAGPSANPSGKISPTTAEHVLAGLDGRIAGVLDGGSCPVGLESTIIGFEGEAPVLFRAGGLAAEVVEETLGQPLKAHVGGVTAPGQLTSHYAPAASMRLNVVTVEPDETLLGFGAVEVAALNLSPSGDVVEGAANLFAYLHKMDAVAARIAVSPVPEIGLGRAINDRLRRAAAPRKYSA